MHCTLKIFLALLLLFTASYGYARMVMGSGSGTVTCSYPVVQSYATGTDFDASLANNYTGFSFTAASSFTMVRVGVTLKQVGTAPDVQITAYIYESDEGTPEAVGALAGTSTDTISAQSIDAAYTEYFWNFAGVSIVSGQNYFIVLTKASTDTSNRIKWAVNDGGVPGGAWVYATTPPTWTNFDDSVTGYYSAISCN